MMTKMKTTLWRFFYLAGMPAEVCGGGVDMTPEQVARSIHEEWPGQMVAFLRAVEGGKTKCGTIWNGTRFIAVRVK